jgi:hypothetical protein
VTKDWATFWAIFSRSHLVTLGSMFWSQFSAIFDNFLRKISHFSHSVVIKFLHNLVLFWVKRAILSPILWQKYLKNNNIWSPRSFIVQAGSFKRSKRFAGNRRRRRDQLRFQPRLGRSGGRSGVGSGIESGSGEAFGAESGNAGLRSPATKWAGKENFSKIGPVGSFLNRFSLLHKK